MDNSQAAAAVFDKYADQYQEKFMAYGPYVKSYERFSRLLPGGSQRVLDVACGPGNIARYLLERHPQLDLLGFDLSPRMVELAAANNPQARFEVRDCRDLAGLTGDFQAIICGFCIPYLCSEDVTELLQRCRDLLCEGGLLYLSFMAGEESQSGYNSKDASDRLYTYYHEPEKIKTLLASQDFAIRECFDSDYEEGTESAAVDVFLFAQLERG